MPFDNSRNRDRRTPSTYHFVQRRPDPRFDTKILQIDMSDNLISEVRGIAVERGVSLYRQIREFVQQGVHAYRAGHPAGADNSPQNNNIFESCERGRW